MNSEFLKSLHLDEVVHLAGTKTSLSCEGVVSMTFDDELGRLEVSSGDSLFMVYPNDELLVITRKPISCTL